MLLGFDSSTNSAILPAAPVLESSVLMQSGWFVKVLLLISIAGFVNQNSMERVKSVIHKEGLAYPHCVRVEPSDIFVCYSNGGLLKCLVSHVFL